VVAAAASRRSQIRTIGPRGAAVVVVALVVGAVVVWF